MAEQKMNDCHLDLSPVTILTNIFLSFLFSPYFDSFFSIIEVEKEKEEEWNLVCNFYSILFYSILLYKKKNNNGPIADPCGIP